MQTITHKYFSNINQKLSWYVTVIKIDNKAGYQDANYDAEDVFCRILNIIYDYNLENLNKKVINFPGIDLGDYKNRISVQVTSDKRSSKIKDTFIRENYINSFDRLIILIIGEKSKYNATFNSGALSFEPKKDIIDLYELMTEIKNLSEEKLKKISDYIDRSIGFETSEKAGDSAFLPTQYNTVYSLCLAKLKALSIKEATADTIIKNGVSDFSYDFPNKVNYLTGGFGCGKSHTLYLYYLLKLPT